MKKKTLISTALPALLALLAAGGAAAADEAEPSIGEKLQGSIDKEVREQAEEISDAWERDALVRGIAKLRHTSVYIDRIEKQVSDTGSAGVKVADVRTDSINTVSAGIVILPNTKQIALTYSTSISGGESAPAGSGADGEAGKAEEFRFSFRPLKRLEFAYEHYRLDSYLTVVPGETLLRIDRGNRDVANGYAYTGNQGLAVLAGGDTARLKVERQRFEGRYYFEDATMFGSPMFFGLFHESFKKPWSSRFEVWYQGADFTGQKVGALYSEAELVSNGLSVGAGVEPAKLTDGFNLQSAVLSLSQFDIELTDDYSLNKRMESQGGGQAFKLALSTEIAYRKTFSPRVVGVVSLFAGYDIHFMDMGRTSTSLSVSPSPQYVNHLKGSWVALSSDLTYGASVSLMF